MKKVLLIHGFEASRKSNWLPWLEKQLDQFGYETINETFPHPEHPDFDEIMAFYRDLTRDFTDEDSMVGHSLGGFIALKLAEELELDRLYVVAPAVGEQLDFDGYRKMWPGADVDALQQVIERGVDFGKIRARRKVAVFSDNDPYIPVSVASNFDRSWKTFIVPGYGHFQKLKYPELFYRIMT